MLLRINAITVRGACLAVDCRGGVGGQRPSSGDIDASSRSRLGQRVEVIHLASDLSRQL